MKSKGNIMDRKVKMKVVNSFLTCYLCKGYLIDATTITECLHTFCKACIVKYLEENVNCPKCKLLIHQSHPLNYISHDRTMQDIVYKLVPQLQEKEIMRQKEFYEKKGLPFPKQQTVEEKKTNDGEKPTPTATDDPDYHRGDEQVNLCLVSASDVYSSLEQRYIRCSAQATVTHLKKFVSLKLFGCLERYKEIDMFCNNELLGKDHTLKFIFLTRCKVRDVTLQLEYRPHIDL